jgi:peptide/nickel transport system substrate-binding protein
MSPTGTNDSGAAGSGASARTNAISRRHVLQLFGIAGVGAAGIGSLEACAPSAPKSEGGGKSASKEFHGAYPYQLPPKGHFNLAAGVTDSIQGQSPYLDLVYPSGGMYYWADKKWEYMMAESSELASDG